MFRSKTFAFIPLALLIGCNAAPDGNTGISQSPIPVKITSIGLEKGRVAIEATGVFSTDNEMLLSFKNGGVIERIYVKEGDPVKKGQILATVNMAEIDARAAQVKSVLEKAGRDYSRATQLYNDSVATKEQMQNAKTALEVARQDWNSIRFNLRYSEIRAPTEGVILRKLANEGQITGPGTPVLQLNGTGQGRWIVKAGVSDRQWAEIKKGDTAVVSSDAFKEEVPATVIRKSEGLDPQSGTFTVYVQPNSTNGLPVAAGMFAKTTIYGPPANGWIVPYAALLDGDGGKGYVFVTDDNKTAKKIEVTIGSLREDNVLVISGLENHPSLIVSGSPYLRDGSKIQVVHNKK